MAVKRENRFPDAEAFLAALLREPKPVASPVPVILPDKPTVEPPKPEQAAKPVVPAPAVKPSRGLWWAVALCMLAVLVVVGVWIREDAQARARKAEAELARVRVEAEWEYACRAGTTGPYAGSLDAMGWYSGNAGGETHAVGQKQPNACVVATCDGVRPRR